VIALADHASVIRAASSLAGTSLSEHAAGAPRCAAGAHHGAHPRLRRAAPLAAPAAPSGAAVSSMIARISETCAGQLPQHRLGDATSRVRIVGRGARSVIRGTHIAELIDLLYEEFPELRASIDLHPERGMR
jgi:hypothetical protein